MRVTVRADFPAVFFADPDDITAVVRSLFFQHNVVAVARIDANLHELDHLLGQFRRKNQKADLGVDLRRSGVGIV